MSYDTIMWDMVYLSMQCRSFADVYKIRDKIGVFGEALDTVGYYLLKTSIHDLCIQLVAWLIRNHAPGLSIVFIIKTFVINQLAIPKSQEINLYCASASNKYSA